MQTQLREEVGHAFNALILFNRLKSYGMSIWLHYRRQQSSSIKLIHSCNAQSFQNVTVSVLVKEILEIKKMHHPRVTNASPG